MRPGPLAALLSLLALCACLKPAAAPETERKGLLSTAVETASGLRRVIPPERVALAGGAVVVAAPQGYCIDPRLTERRAGQGFVALASCRILTGGAQGRAVEPVLMTVTIGPRGDGDDLPAAEDLAAVFQAPLLEVRSSETFTLAHLARGGALTLPGGDRRHWRGAFLHEGRVIGLALYAPRGNAMAGEAGGQMLDRLRAQIIAQETAAPAPKPALGLSGFGRGLMAALRRP